MILQSSVVDTRISGRNRTLTDHHLEVSWTGWKGSRGEELVPQVEEFEYLEERSLQRDGWSNLSNLWLLYPHLWSVTLGSDSKNEFQRCPWGDVLDLRVFLWQVFHLALEHFGFSFSGTDGGTWSWWEADPDPDKQRKQTNRKIFTLLLEMTTGIRAWRAAYNENPALKIENRAQTV